MPVIDRQRLLPHRWWRLLPTARLGPAAHRDLADILTVTEVAEYLRIPQKTVYQLVRSGKLPAFKAGRHWRVTREAVGTYIASATRMARSGSPNGRRPA